MVKYSMQNLDNLTQNQAIQFAQQYQQTHFPTNRFIMLIPFNCLIFGFAIYYTLYFKRLSKYFIKPKKKGLKAAIYYGTIHALVFTTTYSVGMVLVSGVYNPVEYLRNYSKIRNKLLQGALIYDKKIQDNFLYECLNTFYVSEQLQNKIREQLQERKNRLIKEGYFCEQNLKYLMNRDQKSKQKQSN